MLNHKRRLNNNKIKMKSFLQSRNEICYIHPSFFKLLRRLQIREPYSQSPKEIRTSQKKKLKEAKDTYIKL